MRISKRIADGADLSAVEVRRSDVHGRGVFALRKLRAGEVIGHYTGRRYGPDDTHPGWNDQLTYLFGLSDGSVIDGAQGGNATRHINHACIPNVEAVERRGADDELSLVVRTVRALRAGDELFLDYALVIDGDDPADYPCACGTDACRGTMAAPAAMTASVA
jgi:SET domain-containing protein